MIKGVGASSGIAMGKAFVLPDWDFDIPDKEIDVKDMKMEFERLYDGIRHSKQEIHLIKDEISNMIGEQESSIFDAHLAILDDPVFMNEIQSIIERQYKAAEVAVKEAIDKFASMFDLLDDEYMKERAADIKDVGNRLLKHLLGKPEITLPEDNQPFILVCRELSPSQLADLNPEHVLGIINMVGGQTSHSAIMARALGIPFVVGIEANLKKPIETGDFVIVDGETGTVYVNPHRKICDQYHALKQQWVQKQAHLQQIADLPTLTLDGQKVSLELNISSLKDLEGGLQEGIQGVGLYRTEFLYMDRPTLPSEEEQFQVYKQAVEMLQGRPLVIRTLDIGGDKELESFSIPKENNPFLGYRAIRISLHETEIFKRQLRAILRASHYGQIKLMYPMISSVEEIRLANVILEQVKAELREEGIPFQADIPVGITMEVPSAVLIADLLAQEVDFFSVGTNDLIQYTLAVDRMNEHISHLYDPFHPAILRMLKLTADAAKRNRIDIAVCGEMAGDPRAVPVWLGLGIYSLSMSRHSILPVKEYILRCHVSECQLFVEHLLQCKTSEEVQARLDEAIQIIRK